MSIDSKFKKLRVKLRQNSTKIMDDVVKCKLPLIRTVYSSNNSRKPLFDEAFEAYLRKNQDVEYFKEIRWTENQIVYSGNVLIGAIRAAEWEKLLNRVENVGLGIKSHAIHNYIKANRDNELRYAEKEKRRKFFNRF